MADNTQADNTQADNTQADNTQADQHTGRSYSQINHLLRLQLTRVANSPHVCHIAIAHLL